jgi:N-acetyltransferase 10
LDIHSRVRTDFRRRFLTLLSYKFREFGSVTALSVLEAANVGVKSIDNSESYSMYIFLYLLSPNLISARAALGSAELGYMMTPFDLKRLDSYANNMLDYHVVLDLLPSSAALYFERRLGAEVRLSAVQSAILLALGLQRKTIEEVEVRVLSPGLWDCVLMMS